VACYIAGGKLVLRSATSASQRASTKRYHTVPSYMLGDRGTCEE